MKLGACIGGLAAVLASCADRAPEGAPGVAAERQVELVAGGWYILQGIDFNKDGMGDALWYHAGTNEAAVWLLNGAKLLAPGPVFSGPSGGGWAVVTAVDFNGDGMADVLWANSTTNRFAVWLMEGAQVLAPGPEIAGPGDGWTAAAAGDFNGDGMADVLFYHAASNRMAVWLMDGAQVLARGPAQPSPSGPGWSAVTTSDFNHDGMYDVLWANEGIKSIAVWLMDGTRVLAPGPAIPGPAGDGWIATSAADFNADGMADVLWSNTGSQRMAVWLMDGAQLLAPGPDIAGPAGPGWIAINAADANLDGMGDAMWCNPRTDQMAVWLMDGAHLLAPGPVIPGPGG
jgi:hypothetical protein